MTMEDLLRKLLPDLRPETLRAVHRLVGALDLEEPDPADWEEANRQLRELEADPLLQERESLLASELPRLEGHRAALAPLIQKCLKHRRFARLVETGFGTDRYSASSWGKEYHLDRQAAQELEELCSMPFPDILREVAEALEASLVLQARIAEVKERLERAQELETKCHQLRGRLKRWSQVQLETARWKLRRHLEAAPGLLEHLVALFES